MAFHPYPQVIPSVFNRSGFGPPRGLTPASACPWIAHPASRLPYTTKSARLKTRFRCGSLIKLNLAALRQLAGSFYKRHAVTEQNALLRLLVGKRFQVLFHSPLGVLFTFPSRYWFTIGHKRVFRIGGWTPQVPTVFHVSGSTQVPRTRICEDSRVAPEYTRTRETRREPGGSNLQS